MWGAAGLGLLVVAAACYQPAEDPHCAVRCDRASATPSCPDGFSCGSDDRCFRGMQCDHEPVDARSSDTIDSGPCVGSGFGQLCPPPPAQPATVWDNMGFDTDADCSDVRTLGGIQVCIYASTSITINGYFAASGQRPLILVGLDMIDLRVTGRIDVAAGGAGADPMECPVGPAGSDTATGGVSVGGGAGGSFSGMGGAGGTPNPGGFPVSPNPPVIAASLRGGCPGGRGGQVQGAASGIGAKAGGAVYLISGKSVLLAGQIYAWGGGGTGGPGGTGLPGGGGGGGSGGMIVIDAPSITFAGTVQLLAEGGGGGAGGLGGQSTFGGATTDPSAPGPAAGGATNGCTKCGEGGAGSYLTINGDSGNPTTATASGAGGGGGGAGTILFFHVGAITPAGEIAPPPS